MFTCPACESPIPNDGVRPGRMVALCGTCDSTVRVERAEGGWRAIGFTAPAAPEGLNVEIDEPPRTIEGGYRDAIAEPGRFLATRRWWTPSVIFLTFFALAWDSFLVFWYSTALGGGPPGGFGLLMVVFPLVHVAVGVGLTWWVLATWLNTTRIEVAGGRLSCRHGPVPWPFGRPRPVALEAVELFDTEEVVPRFNQSKRNNVAGVTWQVVARTRDGRRVPVVTKLGDERQASYVARRLDAQLG